MQLWGPAPQYFSTLIAICERNSHIYLMICFIVEDLFLCRWLCTVMKLAKGHIGLLTSMSVRIWKLPKKVAKSRSVAFAGPRMGPLRRHHAVTTGSVMMKSSMCSSPKTETSVPGIIRGESHGHLLLASHSSRKWLAALLFVGMFTWSALPLAPWDLHLKCPFPAP